MIFILKKTDILRVGRRLRPRGSYKKTSITIHSTANDSSSAENERRWLDNPSNKRNASWHYVVGEGVVIQATPDSEEAWHSGVPEGNKYSIGIELIESGDRKNVLETAAEFIAEKLKEHSLSMDDIKCHFDWTGKNCPRILIDNKYIKEGMNLEYFKKRIEKYFFEEKIIPEECRIKINGKEYFVERVFINDTNYIKVRDFEKAGFKISYEGDMAILNTP